MAHDNQYKDSPQDHYRIKRYDCPKEGELYWEHHTHMVCRALGNGITEQHLILEDTDETMPGT